MRKTKCKSCNGHGMIVKDDCQKQAPQCSTCQGTGEISVYTIQELREGKVAVINDGSLSDLNTVLKNAFPDDTAALGENEFYYINDNGKTWWSGSKTDLPTQSVKIFLEEIEQEEKSKILKTVSKEYIDSLPVQEPDFKWGEEVEASMYEDFSYHNKGFYCSKDPLHDGLHVIINESDGLDSYAYVRKSQKITLTLSQIAEKFNCKPEQIKILE